MNIQNRPRGIISVGASDPGAAALAQLQSGFEEFKDKRQKELDVIHNELDDINSRQAALQVGGVGGEPGGHITPQARTEFMQFMRNGVLGSGMQPRAEMTTDSDPDGGYTVPSQISGTIATQLLDVSPMRGLALEEKANTSDYNKIVNRRGATSGWVGERETRAETDTPVLANVSPPMGEIYAYAKISQWLLDDSTFNLENWLRENVVDELAQKESAAFFTGTGINQPLGFLTNDLATTDDDVRAFGTLQTVASGDASLLTPDGLVDLAYTVRSPYLAGSGISWMMNRTTAATISKFKDLDDNYLWQRSIVAGQPPTLLGYPVREAVDMPDIGANSTPVAFGNFRRGYLIVDRVGVRVVRDPITQPGFVKFWIYKRVGGATLDTNAIKLQKVST